MAQTITLDDKEYEIEKLSDEAKITVALLQFTNMRLQELDGTEPVLAVHVIVMWTD